MKRFILIIISICAVCSWGYAQDTNKEQQLVASMLDSYKNRQKDYYIKDSILTFKLQFPIRPLENSGYIVHNRLCRYIESLEGILPNKIPSYKDVDDTLITGDFSFSYYAGGHCYEYPVYFSIKLDREQATATAYISLYHWIYDSVGKVILDNFPFENSPQHSFEQKSSSYLQLLYLSAIMANANAVILSEN